MKRSNLFLVACLCILCLPACSLPSTFVPCDVHELVIRINEANATPATVDTLSLSAGCIYLLLHADNNTEGDNGLPVINSPIIINGNGAKISRDPENQEMFRLFHVAGSGDLTLNELTLSGGYAFSWLDVHDSITNGGGAIFNRGKVTIHESHIVRNFAFNIGEGGAIMNIGTLGIFDSTLERNEDGINTILGGAALSNWGEATITGSTFSHNGHLAEQDAIWTQGSLRMTNSTISDSGWGGIDGQYGDVYLNYVTIAYNRDRALFGVSGHWYVTNSLFVFNEGGACSPSLPLSNPSGSNIMDTDGSCGGLTVPEADVHLAPLGNYGGLTETYALEAGSAAIDRVEQFPDVYTHLVPGCIPTDQRGEPRPYGAGCDLGAYEYSGEEVPPAPMPAPTEIPAPSPCTFTAVVPLNCRSGPGALLYPSIDNLPAGESAEVVGQSPDGQYVYLAAPHIAGTCVVPANPEYGTLAGESCGSLAIFTPVPVPSASPTAVTPPDDTTSQPGCTVVDLTAGPGIKCVVPCPEGAVPGDPCTP
jgi:hypothetical protein